MPLPAATLLFLLLFTALPAHGQSPDSAGTPASPANPADSSANAPKTSPEKKKAKKVWTDDDISSAKGTVSVVGDANSSSGKSADKQSASSATDEAKQEQIKNYRDRIQQYQAQMDAIDKRIEQLKNFKAENATPAGGINPNQGYSMVPVEEQVKQLEDKKKQLQSKIDDTEVEARKNGVDSGDLR
jgi:hypothetical protein